MEKQFLTSKQAAHEVGITLDGLNKAIASGRIKRVYKVGRKNLFHPDDIAEYKQRREARRK